MEQNSAHPTNLIKKGGGVILLEVTTIAAQTTAVWKRISEMIAPFFRIIAMDVCLEGGEPYFVNEFDFLFREKADGRRHLMQDLSISLALKKQDKLR